MPLIQIKKHIALVSCYKSYVNEDVENKANAHLLIAAPEMYNLLKQIAEDLDNNIIPSTTPIYKILMYARGERKK